MLKWIFLSVSLFIGLGLFSQVTLQFNQKSYAGDTLKIFTRSDYISGKDVLLATATVQPDGSFSCSFTLEKTALIRIPLYFFEGLLYAEPGKSYMLRLPRKTPLSTTQEVSPFFKPMPFYLYVNNADKKELNAQIYEFDSIYDSYISTNAAVLLFEGYRSKMDTFITTMDKQFFPSKNEYFDVYYRSKMALLRYMSVKRDVNYIVNSYLNNLPVSPENDAYMELFVSIFRDYFQYYSLQKTGERLYDDIARAKSPAAIRETLKMNPVMSNDTIVELVMLKGIHDAFFPEENHAQKAFPCKQLYLTLDSVRGQNKYAFVKEMSENLIAKAEIKYNPIAYNKLELKDRNNTPVLLSTLKGNYVYMAFYDPRNYTCQKDLKLFVKKAVKYAKEIQFVIVVVNSSEQEFQTFLKKHEISVPVFYAQAESPVYNKFGLKAYPHYMVFDPYGIAVIQAAPAPGENFEKTLFRTIEK